MAQEITERDDLLFVQQQVVRLQALLEASRIIHSTTELDEILRTTLRIVVNELEVPGACFTHFPHSFGDVPEHLLQACPEISSVAAPGQLRCVPLLDKAGELITQLVAVERTDRAFTLDEIDFLEGLALQAAVAVENARFHERTALLNELREERETTHRLLLNILPEKVAAELKQGSCATMYFEDATICFTDFVGFTLSTLTMAAEQVVEELHTYFTAFDHVMERYDLEKLKTIGDSYMFASGLPKRHPGNPVNAMLAAFELMEATRVLAERPDSPGWQLRLGMNTGPVIAGVVGIRKFAFDIWGDSVNFASRMESSGAPGRINISERTYERVKDFFVCEPRGKIVIKDKREVEMFFVRGMQPSLIADGGSTAFDRRYRLYFQRGAALYSRVSAGEGMILRPALCSA